VRPQNITDKIARAATLACLLEVSAEKPGNVTPGHDFADMRYEDFLLSALASGPVIGRARVGLVGRTVLNAVRARRRVTAANTNLGVVLLFAPLAAAYNAGPAREAGDLREQLRAVLRSLTVDDARQAYRAIRLAQAGGLGQVGEGDVAGEPDITLRQAMALAAERDSIASEYVSDFAITFEAALPLLQETLANRLPIRRAIVQAFLALLAVQPDTLIARKAGPEAAREVSLRAAQVVALGGLRTTEGCAATARLDAHLRSDGNRLNPGTTADLIAAALFVWLLTEVEVPPGQSG
jgi:triphosphoribosyl-dephospho-CoA synthase